MAFLFEFSISARLTLCFSKRTCAVHVRDSLPHMKQVRYSYLCVCTRPCLRREIELGLVSRDKFCSSTNISPQNPRKCFSQELHPHSQLSRIYKITRTERRDALHDGSYGQKRRRSQRLSPVSTDETESIQGLAHSVQQHAQHFAKWATIPTQRSPKDKKTHTKKT